MSYATAVAYREHWEVQMLIGNYWQNVWTDYPDADAPAAGVPCTFDTEEDANNALADHMHDMRDAETPESHDDYRVMRVDVPGLEYPS